MGYGGYLRGFFSDFRYSVWGHACGLAEELAEIGEIGVACFHGDLVYGPGCSGQERLALAILRSTR